MRRRLIMLSFLFLLTGWTTSQPLYAENTGSSETVTLTDPSVFGIGASVKGTNPSMNGGTSSDLTDQIDMSEVRKFLDELDQDMQKDLPGFSLSNLFNDLKEGKVELQPDKIGKALLGLLGRELLSNASLIGKLILMAVLCSVLQQLQAAFSGSVSKAAQMMTYLVLIGMIIATFQTALTEAGVAIDRMVGLMQTIFPVMLTLLLAMGNVTTAALFRPLVLGSLTFLATLLKNVILPLFFLGAVLHLFNHISQQFQLKRLAGLLDYAGKIGLGLTLTLFTGTMAIQGVSGGVADGVLLRTAKYTTDAIPVVGKFFKDAVEIVMGSGILLRNTVGVIALLALVAICLGPLVKIIVLQLVFRISAALIEPLGEEELAKCLEQMAKSLFLIFGGVASLTIMFFLVIVIVVGTGNMTVMLR